MDLSPDEALALVAAGILAFLEEVSAYREICRRHAPTTEVPRGKVGWLCLRKRYAYTRTLQASARKTIERLPPGLYGGTSPGRRGGTAILLWRWVRWEGKPVLVVLAKEGKNLVVTTHSPPPVGDLPVFALRWVAEVLRLHEEIVAGCEVEAQQVEKRMDGRWPVQAYLEREMRGRGEFLAAIEDGLNVSPPEESSNVQPNRSEP